MCNDSIDHQRDGDADLEAQGCVRPLWQEPSIEGNTWETQLTAQVNRINLNSDETCGGRFGGTARGDINPIDDVSIRTPSSVAIQGNDNQHDTFGAEITDHSGITGNGIINTTVNVTLQNLDKERREGLRQYVDTDDPDDLEWGDQEGYATGIINQTKVQLIPTINVENGSHIEEIDFTYEGETSTNLEFTEAPHNKGGGLTEASGLYNKTRKGNGIHDNPQVEDWESSNELNWDTSNTGDPSLNWKEDYGEVVRIPATKTDSDVGSEPESATCTGCKGSEQATPDSVYVEGDQLVHHEEVCCTSSCGKNGNFTSYSAGCNNIDRHNCNNHNGINVGERNEGVGNDPGGTYTDYTGYESSAENTVWCGMEDTLTVNADGPNGQADGWIIIDETAGTGKERIVGREGLDGGEQVGYVHYYRNTAGTLSDEWETKDFLDEKFDSLDSLENPECQGEKEKCIKYIDFWTDPSGNEWQQPEDAVNSEIIYEFTADQGYSICKNINRIYQNYNDVEEELVVCDYKENPGIDNENLKNHEAKNIAPLPEACGDEPGEHVYWMEGPEVHDRTLSNYHAHQQKCVDLSEAETQMDGISDVDDACLNKGELYREGAVIPISRQKEDHAEIDPDSPDYMKGGSLSAPPIDNDNSPDNLDDQTGPPVYEAEGGIQRETPDWEVCLNIDQELGSNEEDIGGEWYDLDDPKVGEYLRGDIFGPGDGQLLLLNLNRFNRNHVTYYWRKNQNPRHSVWNPMGMMKGTSLDSDCGNRQHPEITNENYRNLCGDDGKAETHFNPFRQAAGYTNFRDEVY